MQRSADGLCLPGQMHLQQTKCNAFDLCSLEGTWPSEPITTVDLLDLSMTFASNQRCPKLNVPVNVQVYTGGDVCAETGKPRHTILVIACPSKGRQPLYISETSPCAYTIVLYHAALCEPWSEIQGGKPKLAFQDEL